MKADILNFRIFKANKLSVTMLVNVGIMLLFLYRKTVRFYVMHFLKSFILKYEKCAGIRCLPYNGFHFRVNNIQMSVQISL